ncbi:MAG: FHA domain-containing protein [Isosphaerales bacterium]
MKAELIPENGDPAILIERDVTVVGRHQSCDVVIDHAGLSKRHCVLVRTDGLLVIRDLASTNGTKVKGQRIRWAALLPEDKISLGGYKVRIYLGSDEMPSPSEQRGARPRLSEPPLPSHDPGLVAPGFADLPRGLPAEPVPWNASLVSPNGGESDLGEEAESGLMEEGFEIIDDDDDDEIIELD